MKGQMLISQLQKKLRLKPRMTPGPIGVYFGNERVDMVQFDVKGSERRIRTAASLTYPTDREQVLGSTADLKKMISEIFNAHPFHGNRIVTSLPPNMLQVINMQYRCGRNQTNENALIKAVMPYMPF